MANMDDDYIYSLLDMEDDFLLDLVIPIFFALFATIAILLKRRL
jgi:hypothetical protein